MNISLDIADVTNFSATVRCVVPNASGETWRGEIRGPFCRYASTLPTTVEMASTLVGGDHVLEGKIVDPCLWSPQSPAIYRLVLKREEAEHAVEFSLPGLTRRGESFYRDGRRWVFRAASVAEGETRWAAWREQSMGIVSRFDGKPFTEAMRNGVPTVALSHDDQVEIYRGGNLGVITNLDTEDAPPRGVNTIQMLAGPGDEPNPAAFACLADANDLALFSEISAKCPGPLIAMRNDPTWETPAQARRACERLQRDLAKLGDFAGYVV